MHHHLYVNINQFLFVQDNAVCLDSCDFQQSIYSGQQSIKSSEYLFDLDIFLS